MTRIFRHYMPKVFLMLLCFEAFIFFASIYVGASLRFLTMDSTVDSLGPLWPRAIIFFIVFISTMTAMGMYDRHSRHSISFVVLRSVVALMIGFSLISFAFYIFPVLYIGRGVLFISLIVSLVLIIMGRVYFFRYLDLKHINNRILVLGAGKKAAVLKKLLRRKSDRRGIEIVAYVSLQGESLVKKSKIIDYTVSLEEIVSNYNIDEIVLAVEDRRKAFPMDAIVSCRMNGVVVTDYISFIEQRACKILVNNLDPSWLMYSDGFRNGVFNITVKRIFDIVVSSILLVIFSPILLIAMLGILIEDKFRGSVFYNQQRVGLNEEIFKIYKLRSMRSNSEAEGKAQWASKDDNRITKIGALLRKFRIDEMPQLINVIKGDMSFVGPRPERPEFVCDLAKSIPYFSERHRVKPGITGWAQICYPYGASVKDASAKLEYDLYYVKNSSLFLDLVVLFQTAQVVLFGKGAR